MFELFQSHKFWVQLPFIKLKRVAILFWEMNRQKIGQETWLLHR